MADIGDRNEENVKSFSSSSRRNKNTVKDIIQALVTLNFFRMDYSRKKHLAVVDIVITALSQVWKAHWRSVIDNVSFDVYSTLQQTHTVLQLLYSCFTAACR
ncbi:hypothetical protein CU098_006806 [Rhizopus stolonifer]|uniref:Uncharacterized protein n=1 Tax=Rhizopus stolonifer TaxID=4846 RepID=A0A367IQS7_RHIST|nr:hypothetical protein CU098_006806 [Rhizopus stolonifer]